MNLNPRSFALCQRAVDEADRLRIAVRPCESGARILDFGVAAPGGVEAGLLLARIASAGLADIDVVAGNAELYDGPAVQFVTDQPALACLASQYAGWEIKGDGFFAMGSGPMRAAAAREPLFGKLGMQERAEAAVGVLECRRLPPPDICRGLAEKCGVAADQLTLAVAPTASLAGTVQIVARSVETALHKLLELDFDPRRIVSGYGLAPLPPVAGNDLTAIGRTNDAILYGGKVTLWLHADDDELATIGRKVPSSASPDHGRPFSEVFKHYGGDFYRIDPHLFSPAMVTFVNLTTGHTQQFGHVVPRVIHESFGGGGGR